jgi:hypothetical protein
MTMQLPNWFIPKYREEVLTRAQQKKRKLEGLTSDVGTFIGDDCHFPRFGSVETYQSSRMAALALANADMDWVKKNAVPEFVAFGLWDPDRNKLNINAAGHYAEACVKAINRAHDRQIIDALADAAANGVANTKGDAAENITTIGDYNTVADLELIATAISTLGTNEMFEDEQVSLILPFKLQVQNALDPYLAKMDMKSNRPWDQIAWKSYERLPGNGAAGEGWLAGGATGVDMFVFAKSAVASAQNDTDVPINERLGANLADMIGQWFQACAKALEPKGIIRIKSKLDFTLLRHAMPVEDVGA